jgi:hypothetical protein
VCEGGGAYVAKICSLAARISSLGDRLLDAEHAPFGGLAHQRAGGVFARANINKQIIRDGYEFAQMSFFTSSAVRLASFQFRLRDAN